MPARRETRNPFSYPVNRLILRVGMWFQGGEGLLLPLCPTEAARAVVEAYIRERFLLDQFVGERVLARYTFVWHPRGKLLQIDLVPHARQRRTPYVAWLRAFWLPPP